MKSRERLDLEVIEAAEEYLRTRETWEALAGVEKLRDAVRARREAMRPHKAAVLSSILQTGTSAESRDRWDGFPTVMDEWNRIGEGRRNLIRSRLAEILAAPDEETP